MSIVMPTEIILKPPDYPELRIRLSGCMTPAEEGFLAIQTTTVNVVGIVAYLKSLPRETVDKIVVHIKEGPWLVAAFPWPRLKHSPTGGSEIRPDLREMSRADVRDFNGRPFEVTWWSDPQHTLFMGFRRP